MTLRDIAVAFGFEVDQSSVNKAENSIKGIKNMASKLLGALGVVFSVKGLSDLAQAAADVEALNSQFKQVFGEIESTASESLQKVADDAGANVNRMKGSFTQLAAFAKTTEANEAEALEIASRGLKAASDSAAFYDRSLEDVTASLQSFLKGNYANDAALGLSCTEITRNTAANKLYGKSFKDLSEYQKQLTLLKMVEDANDASGALGQAHRESETWTNQLGNLKQSITDLKAAAGGTFLQPAIKALKSLNTLVQKATKAVKAYAGENGFLSREMERLKNLFKFMKPTIDRFTQSFQKGISKCKEALTKVVDKLGGVDNVLRIVTIAVGAFVAVFAFTKIFAGLKFIVGLLGTINLTTLGTVAIIVILVLLVEDFINFLQGNDSVLGTMLENAGIDCEDVREKIEETWNKITEFLTDAKDTITQIAEDVKTGIEDAFEKGKEVVDDFKTGIEDSITWMQEHETALGLLAIAFGTLTAAVAAYNIQQAIKKAGGIVEIAQLAATAIGVGALTVAETAHSVASGIAAVATTAFGAAVAFLTSPITLIILAIGALIAIVYLLVKNWDKVKEAASKAWEWIKGVWETVADWFNENVIEPVVNFFKGLGEKISNVFQGVIDWVKENWQNILLFIINPFAGIFKYLYENFEGFRNFIDKIVEGVKNTVTNIKDKIVEGFQKAIDWIKELPAKAIGWGKDFIDGLVEGITGAIGKVTDAVKGVAEKITSFLHFSVPDVGPLVKYESWMPDFMSGLAKGISDNEDLVLNKVKGLAGGIELLMTASTAKAGTASTGAITNNSSSVVQNVNIANSYSGGSMETQRNVSKAMKKSAVDTTTQMARALAYARG